MKLHFVTEKEFNQDIKDFYINEWPSANQEVFGFSDQKKWKMEEHLISARVHDKIVGVAQFRIIGGVGYLSTILVQRDYRGKGIIGEALLQKFEGICKEKRCHKLGLKTYKDSRAFRFFQAKGYKEEGFLINDIHQADWVMMAKFLEK